jgi:CelD/BcsL family acetyltransferase involved in cellulose biosynthesis
MAIPDDPELLLKKLKSKHRAWIRRKQRELESAFPSKVNWRWMSRFNDIPDLFKQLESVAARTYQRKLGAGFVDDEEHRQRFALFARRGQLRMQLLEIDEKVRAFWIGIVYKGVFHSSETGYDPDLRMYEVGTQVFIRMVNELTKEGVRTLDFGLGEALYKERFGDQREQEATIRLFAPSAKGMAMRSVFIFVDLLDRIGRHLAKKFGFLDQVKTGWRRRLEQNSLRTRER